MSEISDQSRPHHQHNRSPANDQSEALQNLVNPFHDSDVPNYPPPCYTALANSGNDSNYDNLPAQEKPVLAQHELPLNNEKISTGCSKENQEAPYSLGGFYTHDRQSETNLGTSASTKSKTTQKTPSGQRRTIPLYRHCRWGRTPIDELGCYSPCDSVRVHHHHRTLFDTWLPKWARTSRTGLCAYPNACCDHQAKCKSPFCDKSLPQPDIGCRHCGACTGASCTDERAICTGAGSDCTCSGV